VHYPTMTPEERAEDRAHMQRLRAEDAAAEAEAERNMTPKQRELMRRLDEDPEMELTPEMIEEAARE
jgi:hypothetical protein